DCSKGLVEVIPGSTSSPPEARASSSDNTFCVVWLIVSRGVASSALTAGGSPLLAVASCDSWEPRQPAANSSSPQPPSRNGRGKHDGALKGIAASCSRSGVDTGGQTAACGPAPQPSGSSDAPRA